MQPVFTHEFFGSFEIAGLDGGYDLFMLVDQFIHISDLAEVDVFYSGSVAAQRLAKETEKVISCKLDNDVVEFIVT